MPASNLVDAGNAEHNQQAEAMTHVVEDDDAVIMPAAPMEYLGHARVAPKHKRIAMLKTKSLQARRTAIPILLVLGIMFTIAGLLKFFVSDESPVSEFPIWMPIVFFVLAAICLVLAVLNMAHVGKMLAEQRDADVAK
jgi:protein-S-isoprenylcysteine O-methyltransferase Ste14